MQWLEKGEKSTQYFFSLEKFNYIKKQVRKLILDNGETVTTDREIMKESVKFYEKLYELKRGADEDDILDFLSNKNISTLNNSERESCDQEITVQECFESLSSFKNNKSPGNDGLTKEFYIVFWSKLTASKYFSHKKGVVLHSWGKSPTCLGPWAFYQTYYTM